MAEQTGTAELELQLKRRDEANRILETCFRLAAEQDDPRQSLEALLTYLGQVSRSDRIFIFEKTRKTGR